MIYLFYGNDSGKVRGKAFEWVAVAQKKEPNLTYTRLSREEIGESVLLEAVTSNSLFAKRTLTLIDDPYTNVSTNRDESEDESGNVTANTSVLDDYIDMLAESENAIVILAPRLSAARTKELTTKAKIAYKFDSSFQMEPKKGFNSALVNALGMKNREKLWLEIIRAQRAGDAPEMLHGLLHWKARDLMGKLNSPTWSPDESRALSLSLINLLQSSRRKGLDLSESLERFALSV